MVMAFEGRKEIISDLAIKNELGFIGVPKNTERAKFLSDGFEQAFSRPDGILPSRHKTKRLPYGICTLVVSNTYLKQKMLVWIDQLPNMVLNVVAK